MTFGGNVLCVCQVVNVCDPLQLRTFRKRYAELRNHMTTAAKLHSEEIAEKVPSKEQEIQFIKVS